MNLIWFFQKKDHLNKFNLEMNITKCLKFLSITKPEMKNLNIEERRKKSNKVY